MRFDEYRRHDAVGLADRVLKAGGTAIAPNGRAFTADSIGSALAQRSVMEHIRSIRLERGMAMKLLETTVVVSP